jgi:class 3 adenylate cyclase
MRGAPGADAKRAGAPCASANVELLTEHRKVTDALVLKHGGRLVKTTGDGVLLEFPSVVDAVECAVAMQAVMASRWRDREPDHRLVAHQWCLGDCAQHRVHL